MSKVLDYFETDKAVDARKVAVQGHSRDGQGRARRDGVRRALPDGFISSSGRPAPSCIGGSTASSIENIAALNEYHWMAGNF